MPQTYRTRHLTARESALVDELAKYPRYAALVDRLRPPKPKPTPRARDDEPGDARPNKPSRR